MRNWMMVLVVASVCLLGYNANRGDICQTLCSGFVYLGTVLMWSDMGRIE